MKIEFTKQDEKKLVFVLHVIGFGVSIGLFVIMYMAVYFIPVDELKIIVDQYEVIRVWGSVAVLTYIILWGIVLWFVIRIGFELYYLAQQSDMKVKK